jgi:hypothetical protein
MPEMAVEADPVSEEVKRGGLVLLLGGSRFLAWRSGGVVVVEVKRDPGGGKG